MFNVRRKRISASTGWCHMVSILDDHRNVSSVLLKLSHMNSYRTGNTEDPHWKTILIIGPPQNLDHLYKHLVNAWFLQINIVTEMLQSNMAKALTAALAARKYTCSGF